MAINTFLPTGGSWSFASNWSLGTIPTNNGDTIIFTASSGRCVLDTIGTCSNIDFTSYGNTFSFRSNSLSVLGNITFWPQMTFSFSSTAFYSGYNLVIASSSNILTNGCTISVPLCFYNNGINNTYNLNDTLNISQKFGTGASITGLIHTINGNNINLYSSFQPNLVGTNAAGSYTTGNSTISMNGIGSILTTNGVKPAIGAPICGIGLNLNINTSATLVTLSSYDLNNLYFNSSNFFINGTPSFSGTYSYYINSSGTFTFSATSSNSSYILPFRLGNTSVTGITYSVNLASDVHLLTGISSNGLQMYGNRAFCYGDNSTYGYVNNTSTAGGTTEIVLTGTSSSSNVLFGGNTLINNNVTINSLGNIILGNPIFGGNIFKWISGTFFPQSSGKGIQVSLQNNPTFDTSNAIFPYFYCYSTGMLNLSSNLLVNNFYINNGVDAQFIGPGVWIVDNFYYINGSAPGPRLGCGLSPLLTYTINNEMKCVPTSNYDVNIFTFRSLSPGTYSYLTMVGSKQTNIAITSDNIDSSRGNTIYVFNYNVGTASINSVNWHNITAAHTQQISISLT